MSATSDSAAGVWIPAVFFGLSAWFFLRPGPDLPSLPGTAVITAADIDPAPRREIPSDPPTIVTGGYDKRCSDCHQLFETSLEETTPQGQHDDIVFDHGFNNHCANCHSYENRDKLVLYANREIGYDQVEELCRKCHGPTYRDWAKGMHGKTLVTWDAGSPDQGHLKCTQCHDPHAPAFPPIKPLPGPNTLRMGDQDHDGSHEIERNPLLRHMRAKESHGE